MSDAPTWTAPQPLVERPTAAQPATEADLIVGAVLAVALAVLGALLGLVWSAWSPPGPAAEVLGHGTFAVLDESEAFVAGDGRFLVIAAGVGLLAALLTWFIRPANRGPLVLVGLCVGSAAGALLTELVGHLTGGGSFTGTMYQLSDGTHEEVTLHLPLSLHMQGLLAVGPAVVALVYGVLVAFTAHDDLGRPDPVRAALTYRSSVRPGDETQDGWRDGDAAGPLQQGDLPPQ